MGRYVYFFGEGKAEGRADMKNLLGGKGANLAEMTNLGIPVPPGFTISTEVCDYYYKNGNQYPAELRTEVVENLRRVERVTGMKFGDPSNPLLVSVRSGAAASMPGMMDTVLNLGINDQVVEGLIRKTGNPRFAWDAFRRFMQMYGDVVRGVEHHAFEEALQSVKKAKGVEEDTELDAEDLKKVVALYRGVFKKHTKEEFPTDPMTQLWGAIDAVFGSWNNERAIKYRELNSIKGLLGTAVNVQTMVFGNFGNDSGHRRLLHPRPVHRREHLLRRVPDERAGRGRGGGHPHAADHHQPAQEAAAGLRPARGLPQAPGVALPRHAGHGVHHPAGQALHAADQERQAHRARRGQGRGRHGQGRGHQQGGGAPARRARTSSTSSCTR